MNLEPPPSTYFMRRLCLLVPVVYAAYYAAAAVMIALSKVQMDGREPFEHVAFSPEFGGRPLATWLSMVFIYTLVGPIILYFGMHDISRPIDYATLLTLIHLILTVATTQSMPQNWVWWVTLGGCWLVLGQVTSLLLTRWPDQRCGCMRRSKRTVSSYDAESRRGV